MASLRNVRYKMGDKEHSVNVISMVLIEVLSVFNSDLSVMCYIYGIFL
jgi:hypothetical protein